MANQEITVNTDTLASDIAELTSRLNMARRMLTDMFAQIQELDAMWDGPANNEFNRQFANDHENAKGLCQTVESLINCMEYAKEQYNSCENQVNGIVSAINI
jgi:WXG100 family type VII secretion target